MNLSMEVQMEIIRHSLSMAPYEICGLVIDGAFYSVPNVAEKPFESFQIDSRLSETARQNFDEVMIVHSHPRGPMSPTQADMEGWRAWGQPWVICGLQGGRNELFTLDDFIDQPLVGRDFRHGVFDCYSLIRSYYWQERGVLIPDFPRSDNWWLKSQDLYSENFEKANFRQLSSSEKPKEGDVFLMSVSSPVLNHGGVYIGGSRILHHLPNRLSRREPLGGWGRRVDKWLRYEGGSDE